MLIIKLLLLLAKKLLLYNLDAKNKEDAFPEFKTEADNFLFENLIYSAINLPDNRIAVGTVNKGTIMDE